MKKVLLLASRWPEPASSAAGLRTQQLLEIFRGWGWSVSMMTSSAPRPTSLTLPDDIQVYRADPNESQTDVLLQQADPDLVWYDRFYMEEQFGWRVSRTCPNAKHLLDTIDLHSLRELRKRSFRQQREIVKADWLSDIALRELASIYRCDLSLMISSAETKWLTDSLGLSDRLLFTLPFLVAPESIPDLHDRPGFEERADFFTIGNLQHEPNVDSVRWIHRCWPEIRKAVPDAHMRIAGADVPPSIQQLHAPQKGFHILGRVEDAVAEASKARVCFCPLHFGAGLKGKLLDAMLAGTPSVTTPVAAEGMQGHHPWPGLVAEEEADLIQAAITLYQDPEKWKQAQSHIPGLLREQFDWQTHESAFQERVHAIWQPTESPDLIQAMLRHHSTRASEYMSRWIEAKNRIPPTQS